MNKNLVIALLVLAGGAWYYFRGTGKSEAPAAGVMSADGVYTDAAAGFSVAFPAGWKEVPASYISAANGYKFALPPDPKASLVVIPPGAGKAALVLLPTRRKPEDMSAFARRFISAVTSYSKQDLGSDAAGPAVTELPASPGAPRRLTGYAKLEDNSLSHFCFFEGKDSVFILYGLAEPGYDPALPAALDSIAAAIKRV